MIVAAIKFSIHFEHSRSLKEKRSSLKSIIERLKHRYNISVMEVDDQDLWQKATVGITFVSLNDFQAQKKVGEIRDFIDALNKGTISQYDWELVKA